MPITNEQQLDIIEICNGFFDGAPGPFLNDFIAFIENGGTLEELAAIFESSSVFNDTILGGQTTTEAKVTVLMENYGLTPGNPDPASADAQAEAFFTARLNAGVSVAEIVIEAKNYLEGTVAPEFVEVQILFQNKAAVGAAYSAAKSSTDIAVLQGIYDSLPKDKLLTQEQIDDIVNSAPGDTNFTLSAASDSVLEGQALTYTLTASAPVAEDTVVSFKVVPSNTSAADQGTSDTNLNDFAAGSFNPVNVTIPAGETTATFEVTPADDNLTELPENFTVTATVNGQTLTQSTELLDGAGAFILTVDGDNFTGTAINDVFSAIPAQDGSGNLIDTLQNVDVLDGMGGTDTLNATITGNASPIAPTLNSIEEVNARFSGAATLDFVGSTGVDSISASQSTAVGTFNTIGSAQELNVSNQSSNVIFNGSTASSLMVGLHSVGANAPTNVNLTDADATSLMLRLDNNDGKLVTLEQNDGTATAIDVEVMGDNVINFLSVEDAATTFSVSGNGSLTADATNSSFDVLTDLEVWGNASVDLSAPGPIGTLETITASGTSGDVIVIVNDTATSIETGSGNDNVTQTATLVANASVDLGGGNDTYTIGAANDDATASVEAGQGEDTLTSTAAIFATPIANPSIYMGFDVLAVSDVLPGAFAINVADFDGIDSFKASDGVAAAGTATVSGVGNGSTVTLGGNLATNTGSLDVQLADASGNNDSLDFIINTQITQNNNAIVDPTMATANTTIAGVENLNVESTGTPSVAVTTGAAEDIAENTLALTNNNLVMLHISGDQMLNFTSAAAMDSLTTIDASANSAGVNINVTNAMVTAPSISITGTDANDVINGADNVDTIIGGDGDDTIVGNGGADILSGGDGNDVFSLFNVADSSLVNLDVISDFSANTVGQGVNGAVDENGATATVTDRDGDVIDLTTLDTNVNGVGNELGLVDFSIQSSSADALTFLNNAASDTTINAINIALDSSTGRIFIDASNDGTTDSVVELTGVTTLNEAAFVI